MCILVAAWSQALPKIGLGTHLSDLSNILLNGAELVLAVVGWLADALEAAGNLGAAGIAFVLVLGVLILRF